MTEIHAYGDFMAATADQTQFSRGDIAVVISRKNAPLVDLLFENGKTLYDLEPAWFKQYFTRLFSDPGFIVDGCSCSDSWQKAHLIASKNR